VRIEAEARQEIDGEFESVEEFNRLHPGYKITAIDGKLVEAVCEGCGKHVVEGEERHAWADDVVTCAECGGPEEGYETAVIHGAKKRDGSFQCPDCGKKYENYYDGHDCHCGKTNICNTCYQNHKNHDEEKAEKTGG